MSDGIYPVGDAYQHYSENYPYSVSPQFRSNPPIGPEIQLRCPPDPALQSVIFDGSNLVVIKGWQWKTKFELDQFFAPISSFFESEIDLKSTTIDPDDFITLEYSFLNSNNNKASFLAILPVYNVLDEQNQTHWKIKYRFLGETEWKNLGRILMLSTPENEIEKIQLKNEIGETIPVRIIVGGI